MTDQRVAVVTGGNRGLGRAACEKLLEAGYAVALTAREEGKAATAANDIEPNGGSVKAFAMDIRDTASVREAIRRIFDHFGRIDVLINNAGIYLEKNITSTGLAPSPEMILETIETNSIGPYRTVQAVLPIMRDQDFGRIVNVSSQMARLATMGTGAPGYRMSKTALNSLTRAIAAELGDGNIKINAADPGWVKTDMGGDEADRSIDEGVDTIVWLATLPDDGPTGGFFRDRQPTDW